MKKTLIGPVGATLLCINILIGSGIFINASHLVRLGGIFGCAGYLFAGFLILPLVFCIIELAKIHPVSGGVYVYSKEFLSSTIGFLSGWSYFVARSTSAALLTNVSISFIKNSFPALSSIPLLALDYSALIGLFCLLAWGIRIGGKIQYFFSFLKAIPLFAPIIALLCAKQTALPATPALEAVPFGAMIPITLYAFVGFETICSIASLVENPRTTIKRAILIALAVVMIFASLFEYGLFSTLGTQLSISPYPLLSFGLQVFPEHPWIGHLLNSAVFFSIFGGIINILLSNSWNLYTLGLNNHLPGSSWLTSLTTHHVPWLSLMVEVAISATILTITHEQIPLQNITVFSVFIAYLLSSIALIQAKRKGDTSIAIVIPIIAIATCLYVLYLALCNMINFGISFSFLSVFCLGLILALFKTISSSEQTHD